MRLVAQPDEKDVVLLVQVAVKVPLEALEGVQERPMGVAVGDRAVVVVAEYAQPRQQLADLGMFPLVLCDHALIDGVPCSS